MCQNTILPDLSVTDYFSNTIYFHICAVIILMRKKNQGKSIIIPLETAPFKQHRVLSLKYALV